MEEDKIEHIHCKVCNKQLSEVIDRETEEIEVEQYIEIKRSYKDWEINDNCVEADERDENVKTSVPICKECFVKILNESKILGDLFWHKESKKYLF